MCVCVVYKTLYMNMYMYMYYSNFKEFVIYTPRSCDHFIVHHDVCRLDCVSCSVVLANIDDIIIQCTSVLCATCMCHRL